MEMEWKSIRGVGKTCVLNDIPKGPAYKDTAVFLDSFNNKFVRQCDNYFKAAGEIPLTYSEKRWQSIMLLSLDKISDAVFPEYPMSKKNSHGWVDYLVLSKNHIYLIELKISRLNFYGSLRKEEARKWKNSIMDLEDTKLEEAFAHFPRATNASRIALMIVPLVHRSKDNTKLVYEPQVIDMISDKYFEYKSNLSPEPNWTSINSLKGPIAGITQKPDDRFARYPAVALFAYVKGEAQTRGYAGPA